MRIPVFLFALASSAAVALPPPVLAHGAIGLVNPPRHRAAPPHPHRAAPPHLHRAPPNSSHPPHAFGQGMPAAPRFQPQSPFMPPVPSHVPNTPYGRSTSPSIIYSEPSLRDRRLFEEELRLRQWHERRLRRQFDRDRWHDDRRDQRHRDRH